MATYTYTIFDANPNSSSGTEWPTHDGVEEDDAARLARAADHISAIDLGDGRWAHYADETSCWYVVTADELTELCDYLDDEDEQISRDAYSHWCAGTSAEEMPEGWDPDQEDEA